MTETVVIDRRFCGPPDSANGGYACGLVARGIDGPAEVTLRLPPPLDTPLQLRRDGEGAQLLDGDRLVAEGRRANVEVDVPAPVSLHAARRATEDYPWREVHAYPTCFVCGPDRRPGDALCIFPGPVDGATMYAAPWTPDPSLAHADGAVRDEFVWSALDCPSGVATRSLDQAGLMLLGRLSTDLRRPLQAGRTYVVQAWPLERDGRKLHTASALFDEDGVLCAAARAVWIEVAAKG